VAVAAVVVAVVVDAAYPTRPPVDDSYPRPCNDGREHPSSQRPFDSSYKHRAWTLYGPGYDAGDHVCVKRPSNRDDNQMAWGVVEEAVGK